MKKTFFISSYLLFLFVSIQLVSCKNFFGTIFPDNSNKVRLTFSLQNDLSRTALPSSIDWSIYTFTLNAKKASTEEGLSTAQTETLISEKPDNVVKEGLELSKGYYIFELKGYLNNDPVISGESGIVNLSEGNKNIVFYMHPDSSGTGNAEITLNLPKNEWTLQSVKSYITQNVLGSEPADAEEISYWNFTDGDTYKSHTYTFSNISGNKNFAVFRIYTNSGCIASRIESIIIIPGQNSTSTITLKYDDLKTYSAVIPLQKSNESGGYDNWSYSGKELILVDNSIVPPLVFPLTEKFSDGVFYGNAIPEGTFDIYIRDVGTTDSLGNDTALNYNSKDNKVKNDSGTEVDSVAFDKLSNPSESISLSPVEPLTGAFQGENKDEIYVLKDNTNEIEFSVGLKEGYEADSNGDGITINNTLILDKNMNPTQADTNSSLPGAQIKLTPEEINNLTNENMTGTTLKVYQISYDTNSGSWTMDETATQRPTSYTVKNYPALPGRAALNREDSLPEGGTKPFDFDGWKNTAETGTSAGKTFTSIPEGTTGDLTLKALWKEGSVIYDQTSIPETDEDYEDIRKGDIKGKIFACGYSLIIKWKDNNGTENDPESNFTEVYYDYNNNGIIDGSDKKVSEDNFSNFKLVAENSDGTKPASDFKFTILGGNLAGLKGLGKDESNISSVYISGPDTVIGNGSSTGVILSSITGEHINVDKELENNYSVTLISENKYTVGKPLYEVAYIYDKTYATFDKFKCVYNKGTEEVPDYEAQTLSIKDSPIEGYPQRQAVYLANPNPIYIPPKDSADGNSVEWKVYNDVKSNTDFSLGNAASITVPCSVFSITVEHGSFQVKNNYMTSASTNQPISTDNLGSYVENGVSKYHDKSNGDWQYGIKTDQKYKYIHMLSAQNQIDPASASNYLKDITFYKESANDDIVIRINLETVDFNDIKAFAVAQTGKSETEALKDFKYYDGSFYLNKAMPQNTLYPWQKSYDEAKKLVFNGLRGYLMTITSSVENDYIYYQLNAKYAWTGGSRIIPGGNQAVTDDTVKFDQPVYSYGGTDKVQNVKFWDGQTGDAWTGNQTFTNYETYNYFVWQCGPEAGQIYWNSTSKTQNSPASTMYANFKTESDEPNNYNVNYDGGFSTGEECMQFHVSGKWNDMNGTCYNSAYRDNAEGGNYRPSTYIVEFRPYSNAWTTTVATKQSISLEGNY